MTIVNGDTEHPAHSARIVREGAGRSSALHGRSTPCPETCRGSDQVDQGLAGPWSPETLDRWIALGATFETTRLDPPCGDDDGGDQATAEWTIPFTLSGVPLYLLVLGWQNHDSERNAAEGHAEGHDGWGWLVEVWDTPDESGNMLSQVKCTTRAAMVEFVAGLLNLAHAHADRG